MEARTRTIEEWFSSIRQGLVTLPRFQRFEAWDRLRIQGVLENILREPSLPIGALLVLEIGDEELFHSRPIVGAPEAAEKPSLHLLDGQQRMTALWRSLTRDYEDLLLFVSLRESRTHPTIEAYRRWDRKGVPQPVWAHDDKAIFERGLIPVDLLEPGSAGEKKADAFCENVEADRSFDKEIMRLRQRIAGYKIPFLSLPVETEKETALDVFINMNTSAAPLKDFDIVVAQLESAVGESLHDMMTELHQEVPALSEYRNNEDIALSVGALLNGKPPLKKTYLEKSFGNELADVWPSVVAGIKRGIAFLHEEAMFSDKLVTTDVAVYLVSALWAAVPDGGTDAEGRARTIIRKALWRASFTDRYLKTASTRAFADHKDIAALIADRNSGASPALFDDEENPLPTPEELARAGWPTKRDRLGRAILCASLRSGGLDFADGARASAESVKKREYHHVFPVATLDGDREDFRVNRALNCALITWKTNRKIAANSPRQYLEARAADAHLGEDEVRHRLASHLIPYDALISGDYDEFILERAALMANAMSKLCSGQN
tara:strand:- start:2309 stop:3961 length:1653 start_codon:yes stop_codon:yes gene_type:complete